MMLAKIVRKKMSHTNVFRQSRCLKLAIPTKNCPKVVSNPNKNKNKKKMNLKLKNQNRDNESGIFFATILTCGHYAGACSCPEEEDCEMSSPRGWPLEVAKPLDNSHCRVRLLPGINPFQKIWSRLTNRTRLKIGG